MSQTKTGSIKMSEGVMLYTLLPLGVQCKRYEGKFRIQSLQDKADTGLWYSLVQGQPFAIQGEGRTPELAVQDSIKRTEAQVVMMQAAVRTMKNALG